jgi:hypothetical protein
MQFHPEPLITKATIVDALMLQTVSQIYPSQYSAECPCLDTVLARACIYILHLRLSNYNKVTRVSSMRLFDPKFMNNLIFASRI